LTGLAGTFADMLAGLRRQRPVLVAGGLGALAVAVSPVITGVVQPEKARARTMPEIAVEVAARVPADAELRFVGPVNGGMRFYLGRSLPIARRPVYQADDPWRCRYLLAWKGRMRQMRPEARAMLAPVLKSAGSGPQGDDQLVLLRARSVACGHAPPGGPIARAGAACQHGRHDDAAARHFRRLARDRASGHVSAAHRSALS
jgi:hypothetical protein